MTRAAPISLALALTLVGQTGMAQTLPDDVISCGGLGQAMGLLGEILAQEQGASEQLATMVQAGDTLYGAMEFFYAGYTSCEVSYEAATDAFARSGAAWLEWHDSLIAGGMDQGMARGGLLSAWVECVDLFERDFVFGLYGLAQTEPNPCGWGSG